MFKHIRQLRHISLVMVFAILFQVCFPTFSYALTSGPAQPEFTSFEPVGTTQMVDLFSGDFTYNIPLFELPGPEGGYPFNLAYHSGRTMEEEASWVGLGWTLNHGAITRQMRGLPDDFNGEEITRTTHMKPNVTNAGTLSGHFEIFGFKPNKFLKVITQTDPTTDKEVQSTKQFDDNENKGSLNVNFGISHNSYKGWGINYGVGASFAHIPPNGKSFDGSLGLNVGSNEGASVSGGFSMGKVTDEKLKSGSLNIGINSRDGIRNLSLSARKANMMKGTGAAIGTTSYSFNKPSYTPSVGLEYETYSFTRGLEVGGWSGATASGGGVTVTHSIQKLKENTVTNKGYGYFYQKDDVDDKSILDFNRGNDGTISSVTKYLATPQMTQDIYSVMGHGTGGSYQAFRSDIGRFYDPASKSITAGLDIGIEGNPGNGIDMGVDLGGNWGSQQNKKWYAPSAFAYNPNDEVNLERETFYFKSTGDRTAEKIDELGYGEEEAQFFDVTGDVNFFENGSNLTGTLKRDETDIGNDVTVSGKRSERKPRASAVQSYTNNDLVLANGDVSSGLFDIQYYTESDVIDQNSSPTESLDRGTLKKHHVGGFTSTESNGIRYNYGLPIYNKEQREYQFSIAPSNAGHTKLGKEAPISLESNQIKFDHNKTNEFYDQKNLPQYVHTYLLTSVVGADYVDADDIPGPSDGDKGYWVKFDYQKTSETFKWRAPFDDSKAFRQAGARNNPNDDEGYFTFGEREQYYLVAAESRTHKAIFDISARIDGKSAARAFGTGGTSESSCKLNNIKMFSKQALDENPLKTIEFDYSNDLCKGLYGNSSLGKLTLDKVTFSYEDSNRGTLSPYVFKYSDNNPSYEVNKVDRWGTYLDEDDEFLAQNFPYTPQEKSRADNNAEAWNLTEIVTPSGAKIEVKYESDDYAYVQDRTAMQMFEITSLGDTGFETDVDDLRVFFKPEQGVVLNNRSDVKAYIQDLHDMKFSESNPDEIDPSSKPMLLYRISSMLFPNDDIGEDLTGYAFVNDYGIDGNEPYIELLPIAAGRSNTKKDYHPFALSAYQLIKTNYADRVTNKSMNDTDERTAIRKFAESFREIADLFRNFYTTCSKRNFGANLDSNTPSFIRLCSPDKIKLGGGVRVAQIQLKDNWTADNAATSYGQAFDYTKKEEGMEQPISSGVAINEPTVGYEECALRYGYFYNDEAFLRSDDYYIQEFPLNENYYPGASVGYSQVTVKSLATQLATNNTSGLTLPNDFGTTGQTVHEFYTAKDYPILVDVTDLKKDRNPFRFMPLGIWGSIVTDNYTGTQGYSIILNDMHGKPHKVTSYGSDKTGALVGEKISEVIYNYKEGDQKTYTSASKKVVAKTLDNHVAILEDFDPTTSATVNYGDYELGVDYEFFADVRQNKGHSGNADIGINASFTPPIFPSLSAWPNLNLTFNDTKTAVTNKVVRKYGVLESVEAYDGQSRIVTTNEVFDPLTGQAILTSVNNMYDDKIYNLSVPARFAYEGMGAAYENIGFKYSAFLLENSDDCSGNYKFDYSTFSQTQKDLILEGDEFLVTLFNETAPIGVGHILNISSNGDVYVNIEADVSLSDEHVTLKVTRSGKRNLLGAPGASIAALSNPLESWEIDYNNAWVSGGPGNKNITIQSRNIDDVLEASAVTYDDNWILDGKCEDCGDDGGGGTAGNCITECVFTTCCPENNFTDNSGAYYTLLGTPRLNITLNNGTSLLVTSPASNSIPSNIDYSNFCQVDCAPYFCSTIGIQSVEREDLYEEQGGGNGTTWFENDNHAILSFDICPDPPTPVNCNDRYASGEKGIWRPRKSYTYLADRKSTASTTNATGLVNLEVDGTFDDMPLFDWNNPWFVHGQNGQNWRQTSEVTKYNEHNDELENRDILGRYQSAIFGYENTLSTAVAGNARYNEVAFQSFEEFPIPNGNLNVPLSSLSNDPNNPVGASDNFLFTSNGMQSCSESYSIVGYFEKGSDVYIDKPFSSWGGDYNFAILNLKDANGNEKEITATITSASAVNGSQGMLNYFPQEDITKLTLALDAECDDLGNTTPYGEKITLMNCINSTGMSNAMISNEAAHSGEQSLFVNNNSSVLALDKMSFDAGKQYTIMAWIHVPNKDTYTFADGFNVGIDIGNGLVKVPDGPIIDGWQRIEADFSVSGKAFLQFKTPQDTGMYVDDIRIQPKNSVMKAYAYDPHYFRLVTALDENNYGTFYQYDEEGNLFQVSRETERGIKTVQENQNFVKPHGK